MDIQYFFRRTLLGLLFLASLLTAGLAQAAVPHDSAKPAYAEEQTILQAEEGVPEPGYGSAASGRQHFDRHFIVPPGLMPEQDVILQRGGNTWRMLRNGPIATIAGVLLILVPLAIFGFYRAVGGAPEITGGRKLLRFTSWDRFVHWATAITFLILAFSGLIVLFGKKVLLPWMGHSVFYWFALISKYLHNFVGPLFIVCSVLMFLTFLRKNLFNRWDWLWIRKGGGLLTHAHVPAGFFNAGEKFWFWGGVTLLGLVMSVTGLMLNFPYFKDILPNSGFTRYLLQMANYFHIGGATLYIAAAMGHIYIGTLGTPGAYRAMREGTVDEAWAQAHHELWYREATNQSPPEPPHEGAVPHGVTPRPRV